MLQPVKKDAVFWGYTRSDWASLRRFASAAVLGMSWLACCDIFIASFAGDGGVKIIDGSWRLIVEIYKPDMCTM